MTNILTIDVEEYFCAMNLRSFAPQNSWDRLPSRVESCTKRILDLLDEFKYEATFFVLGWVAERIPELVREIENRGHEIATHGYGHQTLTELNAEAFKEDLRRALAATQPLVKQRIVGYRAPSFTVVPSTTWAYAVMEQNGIRYDSSVFPINFHPDYGFPNAPLSRYQVSEKLTEVPMSCVNIKGIRLPCSGGGYFRLLPYFCSRFLFRKCIAAGRPVVFYVHPWELDPGQPRYPLPLLKRWRHYNNLGKTEERLRRLFKDFSFTSMRKALSL
jgi:polysaccharide deacetylase family protein (PEP-CTERM system associated)